MLYYIYIRISQHGSYMCIKQATIKKAIRFATLSARFHLFSLTRDCIVHLYSIHQ